jgi:hypothetical protein
MTCSIDTKPTRRLPAKLAAGLFISAALALGSFASPAEADWNGTYYQPEHHHDHYYNGGYYRAPPVVYGSPYGQTYYGSPYYVPPVVYGPGIGFNIHVR